MSSLVPSATKRAADLFAGFYPGKSGRYDPKLDLFYMPSTTREEVERWYAFLREPKVRELGLVRGWLHGECALFCGHIGIAFNSDGSMKSVLTPYNPSLSARERSLYGVLLAGQRDFGGSSLEEGAGVPKRVRVSFEQVGRFVCVSELLRALRSGPGYPSPKRICVLSEGVGYGFDRLVVREVLREVCGSIKYVGMEPFVKIDPPDKEPDGCTYEVSRKAGAENGPVHSEELDKGEVDLYLIQHASPYHPVGAGGAKLGESVYPKALGVLAPHYLMDGGIVCLTTYFNTQLQKMSELVHEAKDSSGRPFYEVLYCGPSATAEWFPALLDPAGKPVASDGYVLIARRRPRVVA